MIKIVQYRYFNSILHGLLWSIVLFFPYLISDADHQYRIGPLPGFYFTLSGIIHMILFYANAAFLYPKLLNKTYWWLYVVFAVLLVFLSFKLKSYILDWWFHDASPDARTHLLFPSVLAFIAGTFYGIVVDKVRSEKQRKENDALRLEMELKLLRSQISPHFLFNILTNFVALARKKSDLLEISLLRLSGLMRYMLYDSGKKIMLKQEVQYLESYISLQTLRFGPDVKVVSGIELLPEGTDYSIEPMLLIPFVENAFKHGTGYEDQPFIEIRLTVKEHVLDFRVMNKFDWGQDTSKDKSSGIGLHNVRSRLALLYPDRHELDILTDQHLFRIHLTLQLL